MRTSCWQDKVFHALCFSQPTTTFAHFELTNADLQCVMGQLLRVIEQVCYETAALTIW